MTSQFYQYSFTINTISRVTMQVNGYHRDDQWPNSARQWCHKSTIILQGQCHNYDSNNRSNKYHPYSPGAADRVQFLVRESYMHVGNLETTVNLWAGG
eukprot:jgi/Botrbrau1/23415/Bobra.0051s0058.1